CWDEHAAFMDGLAGEGFIVLGGPLGDGSSFLHVVDAATEQEITARFAADPWTPMELLRILSIEPWEILLRAPGVNAVSDDGAEAYVEAELDLPVALLDEEELASLAELQPADEEGLTLARRVFADGRTRAYAWGRGAAREDLAAVGERLIAMSGQFEQRRLARSAYQLELLDSFLGEEQLRRRAKARLAWRELAVARRRHEELQSGADAAQARLTELRALVEDTAGLEPEGEQRLRDERERL